MKNHTTVIFILSIFFIILFNCSPNLTDLVKQYPVIYNTHNVKEIVSLYADNAVFEVVGQLSFTGKNQIRNITKYDSVLNINMTISNIETRGDTAFFNLTETNDWLKTADIGEAHYKAKFIFHNGLIKHLRAEAMPETQQAFGKVLTPLIEWAKENKSDVLAKMMPEGKFV